MRTNAHIPILLCTLLIGLSACNSGRSPVYPIEDNPTEIPPVTQSAATEKVEQSTTTSDSPPLDTATPKAASGYIMELEVTFVAARQDGPPGIYAVRLGCPDENPPCIGETQLLFADRLITTQSYLSWSPEGDRVVFSSTEGYPGQNLYIASVDGTDMLNLTESFPKGEFPAWSPDGSQILYTSCQDLPCRVFSISLEDGQLRTFLDKASVLSVPGAVWAVDRPLLTFNAYPDERLDALQVFVSNLDGSDLIQVTNGEESSYAPWISPDGQEVVYLSFFHTNSGQDLLISEIEGDTRILATNPDGTLSEPAWSPIGGWIVFKRHTEEGGTDLFIVREDGSHVYQVTDTPDVWEGGPAWRLILP
ncbi:MAG: hypothetical protein U9N80_03225 [Chloroflexota bacterium]|nr:hypothetical protein [Chloroflexota bacterium]